MFGRLDLVNGTVITGDGKTVLEASSVVVKGPYISEVPRVSYVGYNAAADKVIDVHGGYILPGLVNLHLHGGSIGPFFPYAWRRLSDEKLINNLNNHLLQGTTTILNCDGLALPDEVYAVNKVHPINIKTCTLHTPKNLRAAEVSGGEGIEERHRRYTAAEAVARGAVAIGEIGSPSTTNGTAEKVKRLGRTISTVQAGEMNEAVMKAGDAEIGALIARLGLGITVEGAKRLVKETSIDPVQASCDAIRESPKYSKELGIPALAHTSIETREAVLDASRQLGPMLLAEHVNHTFTVEESVLLARELRRNGSYVEAITGDPYGARQLHKTADVEHALMKEGLVDVLATDYIGGYHDSILLMIQKAVEGGFLSLPEGVRLATSNPARIVPGVAPDRGLIEEGKVADMIVVDRKDISNVRHVIIGGRVIVENGRMVGSSS